MSAPKADYPPELRTAVDTMVRQNGVYLATDTREPNGGAALMVVIGGIIYATKLDQVLDPEKFHSTARISGPFLPTP